MQQPISIGIDFDGTCVVHAYPRIGADIGAVPVLKKLVQRGHQLILNTMRSGKELGEAVEWFENNGIPLHGVNRNPTQSQWTDSPKVYAVLYIDDAALGIPLCSGDTNGHRPWVNWPVVEQLLVAKGIL